MKTVNRLIFLTLFIFYSGVTLAQPATSGVLPSGLATSDNSHAATVVMGCRGTGANASKVVDCAPPGSGGSGGGSVNIATWGGTTVNLGQQLMAASIPVAIASNQVWGLPTGAATAALQSINRGVIGAATAPADMAVIGCVFNTVAPVLTTGQSAACQMTAGGLLRSQDSTIAAGVTNIVSGAAGSIALQIAGVYNATQIATVAGHGSALQIDAQGDLRSVGGLGAPVGCGANTNATINTPTTLLAANLATKHLKIQNNGTAVVLYSFTVTTGLTTTNSFSLAAGQVFDAPAEYTPTSALTVQSATASQPVMCEYN